MFWYMFWILVSYESPAVHPTITAEERCFIEESIGETAKLLGPAEVSDPKSPPGKAELDPPAWVQDRRRG